MSNIIYQLEWNSAFTKKIKIPYCGKCFTRLSMLGLLDKKIKKVQFICNKCKKLITE